MKRIFKTVGSRGFTLMELLTVMAIMGILLSAGIASYVGVRRGAEMRGAVGAIRASLSMARQHAVTKRRPTALVFGLQGDTTSYTVIENYGKASETPIGGKSFVSPGITCQVSVKDGEITEAIRFYPTGKSGGVDLLEIKLTDKLGTTTNLTVYPLLGLVK